MLKKMVVWVIIANTVLLVGCATAPPPEKPVADTAAPAFEQNKPGTPSQQRPLWNPPGKLPGPSLNNRSRIV